MLAKRAGSVIASVVVAGLVACSVYDESLLVDAPAEFDPKSCHWGDCWWSEPAGGCRSADQPEPTERPTTAASGDQEIVFALRRLWLGQSAPPEAEPTPEPWQAFGLDLDRVCSEPLSCTPDAPGAVSCVNPAGAAPDGAGCRDNAFAKLFASAAGGELGEVYGVSEDKLNCGLHRGSFSWLIRVRGYSGEADDDNVSVEILSSPGLAPGTFAYECDVPGWEGQLSWNEATNYAFQIDASAASVISDPAAYVKHGYLVARLVDGAELTLPGDNSIYAGLWLRLSGGLLVARLERDVTTLWMLRDGLIAGRTRTSDLVTSVRRAGLCAGASYDQIVADIDAAADVPSTAVSAPEAACDALSVGIGFHADQASLGPSVPVAPALECGSN